ncbi:homogentisate 1,2-dioxygenase [Guyanagaster necrorhizus]|uniref:homogentisate 1,2-dioxygenase n=1 Tax=Guyanagaster necrorhizus TaxID=856835 RepID=A0A9P8AR43_9AGAR|nr:homogentisate 1,2-dioxygenase [Guyanagaster necrorhizus MCA 3950]KAG7444799.1 homogentisate 1,2-dioxygenase [Guyanagaster necrorhizus MCA 3950]
MQSHTYSAPASYVSSPSGDPYKYQVGFGNRFASEAIPGTLPQGQNHPQKNKYGLYMEGMTGSPFIAPRHQNLHAFMYRIRPSLDHKKFVRLPDNPDMESNFLPINPKVRISPTQLNWAPPVLPSSSDEVDFIAGLKTIGGNGEPTSREGLALHFYSANADMKNKAFCNSDGDMLVVPQQGRLDVQTEFGRMMVRPGELMVIQKGMKFKVSLPDGPSRGYVQEIFGSHFELPDLGPIGGHGMANPRDFEVPLASFEVDETSWEIVYKIGGQLFSAAQDHTPFDVVAWQGNYVPYKYPLEKFIFVGSLFKDHMDPSVFTVLTSKSKAAGIPLVEVLVVSERWDVATDSFRPPYYHRNNATEILAPVFGKPGDRFVPGGITLQTVFCPHGPPPDVHKAASIAELKPERISKDRMAIAFETPMVLSMTDYAMNRAGTVTESEPLSFPPDFIAHLDEINADLKAAGYDELKKKSG